MVFGWFCHGDFCLFCLEGVVGSVLRVLLVLSRGFCWVCLEGLFFFLGGGFMGVLLVLSKEFLLVLSWRFCLLCHEGFFGFVMMVLLGFP